MRGPARRPVRRCCGTSQEADRLKPKRKDVERHLASTALLVSYALYPFIAKKNYWAEFEGWIIFCAHILAVAERLELEDPVWLATFELSFLAARTALVALIREAVSRDHWLEGDVIVDSRVFRPRMTIILGLMALYTIMALREVVWVNPGTFRYGNTVRLRAACR